MSLIANAVREYGIDVQARLRSMSNGHHCEGSKYHSPTPLTVRDLYLSQVVSQAVGEDVSNPRPGEREVWLCGTCTENLWVFVLLMHATNGSLPWQVRREFGNKIRDLGLAAWDLHGGIRA